MGSVGNFNGNQVVAIFQAFTAKEKKHQFPIQFLQLQLFTSCFPMDWADKSISWQEFTLFGRIFLQNQGG